MKFHEDLIFKNISYNHGQLILKLLNLDGKIVRFHPTEYSVPDPKMYKQDLVIEVEDKLYIIEFQSSYVDIHDEKRFSLYSSLIDHLRNIDNKNIEVHVLSTVEKEQTKVYKVNEDAIFPIYIHSLKNYDGDKFLNMMDNKIENDEELLDDELITLCLVPFMNSRLDMEIIILNVVYVICNIEDSYKDIYQFIKGIELIIADKFVKTHLIKKNIVNLLGNMQIVEEYAKEYAKDYVKERYEGIICRMFDEGLTKEDIVRFTGLELEFVNKTLAK